MKNFAAYTLLFILSLASITGCESSKNVHSESLPQIHHVEKTGLVVSRNTKPVRRSWRVETSRVQQSDLETVLSALLSEGEFKIEHRPNGDQLLTARITSLSKEGLGLVAKDGLNRLGLRAARRQSGATTRYQKLLKVGSAPRFRKKLQSIHMKTASQIIALRARLTQLAEPGLIPQKTQPLHWPTGQLHYTGHVLDLAMPASEKGAQYFVEITLSKNHPALNMKSGDKALSRGGRFYLGAKNRLRLKEGIVAFDLQVPTSIQALKIHPNGKIMAHLNSGLEKFIGQMMLVKHVHVKGDGHVFTPAQPDAPQSLRPGQQGVPSLQVGHLEFPDGDIQTECARLRSHLRLLSILKGLTAALDTPRINAPATTNTGRETTPAVRQRQIILASDIPSSVAHLNAMGVAVKTTLGRTTFTFQENPESMAQFIATLSKALRGLTKRMSICQENYSNADRTRDNQKALKPYRRKMVTIGKDAEILIEEDPSQFRKVKKPEHPDAGPDGFVVYPNVDRRVEAAEFRRVSREYALLKSVLDRIAPDVIFPNASILQGEAASK